MSGPGVSVVILNYNGGSRGSGCVSSVLSSDLERAEVVVFDNGSTDHSLQEIRDRFGTDPRVKIVASPVNLGFGGGNNEAARHARGDVLLFLNNDTRLAATGSRGLIDRIRSDPDLGIVVPLIANDVRARIVRVGAMDILGRPSLVPAPPPFAPPRETIASGPAYAIRRSTWDAVGGYDADYFLFMEDIDLAWRVMLLGFRVCVVPDQLVVHEGGANTRRVPASERIHLRFRNSILTLLKNYSFVSLVALGPLSVAVLLAEAGLLAGSRRSSLYVTAFLRAVRWNLSNLPATMAKRRRIQSGRRVPDRVIMHRMTFPSPLRP
ncbi:MAG: glycosyltransferase family 2 protein [Thermoplasmata archaeon]|nr:glycosyltransferase family 2 protein [Thermoplasmata archaeon]